MGREKWGEITICFHSDVGNTLYTTEEKNLVHQEKGLHTFSCVPKSRTIHITEIKDG